MNALPLLRNADRPDANRSLPARLMAVTHFVRKQAMEQLLQGRRHGRLSLAYVQYVILLAERDRSPGELAERLGISKQACSKTVQELQTRGLIRRRANPLDSRSSMLSLSARGIALLREGVEITNAMQKQMVEAVDARHLSRLPDVFDRLCAVMDPGLPAHAAAIEQVIADRTGCRPTRLAVLLPHLSQLFRARLMAAVGQKRFSDLRPGIGQLLGMISEEGRRLQYIASLLGVSKQAAAATAAELEQLGYVRREEDPDDRRQVVVSLSPRGRELLREVAAGVDGLEASIRTALGDADYRLLDQVTTGFFAEVTRQYDRAGALRARIQQLSQQLVDELGTTGAHALAQQLMTMTRGKR